MSSKYFPQKFVNLCHNFHQEFRKKCEINVCEIFWKNSTTNIFVSTLDVAKPFRSRSEAIRPSLLDSTHKVNKYKRTRHFMLSLDLGQKRTFSRHWAWNLPSPTLKIYLRHWRNSFLSVRGGGGGDLCVDSQLWDTWYCFQLAKNEHLSLCTILYKQNISAHKNALISRSGLKYAVQI